MQVPSTKPFFTSEMGVRDLAIKLLMRHAPKNAMMMLKKFHYTRLLRKFSEKQESDLMIVRHLINTWDFAVDVGATIGVYTKFLSNWVGKSGLFYSIEPVPEAFHFLVANIKRLQMKNVKPIHRAISESNGIVRMVIPLDNRGIKNHHRAQVISSSSDSVKELLTVEATTLDSLLSEVTCPIAFVKIDTEDYELQCIKGSLNILGKWKPSLIIEISSDLDNPNIEGFRLEKLLKDRGYGNWWFDGKYLRRRREADRSVNYFSLMAWDVGRLQQKGIVMSQLI